MSYQFAGFFVRPPLSIPVSRPQDNAVWRDIARPFLGMGVRWPSWIAQTPAPDEVTALAHQLGLDAAERWLYLTYDCWGGEIDFVYGLGSWAGVPFGPITEDDASKTEAAYLRLMEQFGVTAEDALRFEPFTRGYWGKN